MGSEDLLANGLGDTVGKGELEVLGEELLDVGAADVLGLLNLDDLDDLRALVSKGGRRHEASIRRRRTWIDRKRARWRAAMSW